jgi:putative membrane protein
MMLLLVEWFLSALSLMIVAFLLPGFEVRSFGTALIASIVIGLVNATLGFVLKVVTFPLTILTLGLFLLVINALMLRFAASLVSGFVVRGFFTAFVGAIILSIVNIVLHHLVFRG